MKKKYTQNILSFVRVTLVVNYAYMLENTIEMVYQDSNIITSTEPAGFV